MSKQEKNLWTNEKIEEKLLYMVGKTKQKTFPTHTEMNDFFGDYSLSNAVRRHGGTRYWAKKIGMEEKDCESKFGFNFEEFCQSQIIEKLNMDAELCPVRFPYDILVEDCVKIDVKSGKIFNNYGRSKYYTFNLDKKQQTCDLYVFYCLDNDEIKSVYIVPSIVLSGKSQFAIGILDTKYVKYYNRWDLIKKYVDFMKECVN